MTYVPAFVDVRSVALQHPKEVMEKEGGRGKHMGNLQVGLSCQREPGKVLGFEAARIETQCGTFTYCAMSLNTEIDQN